MSHATKWLGLILLMAFAITGCALFPAVTAEDRFGILDYQPSTFVEQSTEPFFFSIGDELRFGHSISKAPSIIFKGEINAVYPSPDGKRAAIASDAKLYLVEYGQSPKLLLTTLLTASDHKATGNRTLDKNFYLSDSLQWDAHSRSIFIIRTKKSIGQRHGFLSPGATLARIDLDQPGHVTDVVPDFRALRYFLVGDDAFCFDYALENGNVIWKCARNGITLVAKSIENDRILLVDGTSIKGKPFLSYNGNLYESEIWLTLHGFSLQFTQNKEVGLFSKDRPGIPIFLVKTGHNIKGHFVDEIRQIGCIVLPGGRYALINIAVRSSTVQVLVDGISGKYKLLPSGSRVYRNLNTSNYESLRFGFGWPSSVEFTPIGRLRLYEPVVSR